MRGGEDERGLSKETAVLHGVDAEPQELVRVLLSPRPHRLGNLYHERAISDRLENEGSPRTLQI